MRSTFVLGLNYALCNETSLFLIFPILGGGDLKFHLLHEVAVSSTATSALTSAPLPLPFDKPIKRSFPHAYLPAYPVIGEQMFQ
jgi:hypothetical protein